MAAIAKTTLPQLYSLRTLSEAGYGSIATLRRAIREGRLDAVRVGGNVKVSAKALDAYVRASTERFASNGGEDYRSRTWCLSSGFRLGLRAKVAVI